MELRTANSVFTLCNNKLPVRIPSLQKARGFQPGGIPRGGKEQEMWQGELVGRQCQGMGAAAAGKSELCARLFCAGEALPSASSPRLSESVSPVCWSSDALSFLMPNEVGRAVCPDSAAMDNAMQIASKTSEPPNETAPLATPGCSLSSRSRL